ncbi:MAG TPA: glycosyltransferase family 1 protein, partial [Clostridia bacterium]|nr:glycosyltransferase family 1 protein [Clostridia bacterium]
MSKITLSTGSPRRIGFISTRFHGTDGVSLEAGKWAQILTEQGHSCFWMAGLLDTPPETSYLAPLAFFNHPEVVAVQAGLFGRVTRSRATTNHIQALKEALKDSIYQFINKYQIEVLIP